MFSGQTEGTPHFIALCFTRLCKYCVFFLQIEGLWQPCIRQVYRCHFSKQICSLHIFVSYFGSNSCNISKFHCYYICYGDLWLAIFGVTIASVLSLHELCPYKTWLVNVVCVLLLHWQAVPPSLPLCSCLPYSLRHNNIEIRPVSNLTMASKCSSERQSHTSLTLNQKARND